jgi:hypothetical protein
MANPSDLQSKITRAIKAVLVAANVQGVIIAAPENIERKLPLTTATCGDGDEEPDQPGNYHFPNVCICLEDDAVDNPSNADYAARRTDANSHFTTVKSALTLSADGVTYGYMRWLLTTMGQALATTGTAQQQADNADMADFQILDWRPVTMGVEEKRSGGDKGTFWAREIVFNCLAADSNMLP